MKSLLRTPKAQAALATLLGAYLSFALRTTRWTLDGAEHFRANGARTPAILAFWHEFLPLMPAMMRQAHTVPGYRPVPTHTLVSRHRDGRFIGEVVRRFGITPIFGSSSKGGPAALRALAHALHQGHLVSITPDGPRGPRRQAAAGVAQLAALSGTPILPFAARANHCLRLNTWDRMAVPLPFGRGVIVCGPAVVVSRQGWADSVPVIVAALNQAADRADRLCPA